MPSGPPALHEKWKDDGNACAFLQKTGYTLRRDWHWQKPSPDHVVTDEENEAMYYLVWEWDFGGLID